MATNVLLCGVGGQGTVLASKLIALAALERGENVRTAETIGMAQRGGCVVSHVRTGDKINSPLIPLGGADILIGFEPAEAVRCLPYLKKDGIVIVNSKAVKPVTATLSDSNYEGTEMINYLKKNMNQCYVIDGEAISLSVGSPKVLNIVLLTAAVKYGNLGMSIEELKQTIIHKIPEKYHQSNLLAVNKICEKTI
ncbi:MAG: indolepyruvate oxidoreductase subunit beta [Clostridium sp.]|nr:indolepyruvate oxidoreductase subunit beta [Clostridium sp.]